MLKKAVEPKVKASETKAVEFKFRAPEAKRVSLAGSFNKWDTNSFIAKKDTKGVWTVKAALNPGKYEYKFVVDGSWMTDPNCREKVANTLGSANSVVVVK